MITGVKVFSVTRREDRATLGDRVTAWLADHSGIRVRDVVVTQSSDREFHMVAITIFYDDRPAAAIVTTKKAASR